MIDLLFADPFPIIRFFRFWLREGARVNGKWRGNESDRWAASR
ncbi:MAG: hypothetical protein K0S45_4130 [Nitrospira sp.]|nr:hypothetical protein [Nitrospira sp.]